MIRKIFTLAKYSAVVSIPKDYLRKLGWRRGQKVEMEVGKDSIKIKDSKN